MLRLPITADLLNESTIDQWSRQIKPENDKSKIRLKAIL
jgi:hypothetical protein